MKLMHNRNGCCKKDRDLFVEWQYIIMEDLRRIAYKVSDYVVSEERTQLLLHLNQMVDDICKYISKTSFENDIEENYMDLEIRITENYLAFSYYKLDKNEQILISKPSIALISRNMKNLYFIDEMQVLIQNALADRVGLYNEYEDYSLYSVETYELEKIGITREQDTFESYVQDVTYPCFYETEKMVEKIKKMNF